jgi:sec-independent protein translocase protein TatA
MANVGPLEIAVVLMVVLVVFGPRRLPELGKSMGRGIREFKGSLSTEHKDEIPTDSSSKPAEIVDGEVVTERRA